jgi:nucleotide-binding universal stress UspA family protein
MKKILIATDFSKTSTSASIRAVELFCDSPGGLQLTLLNAYMVTDINYDNAVLTNDHVKHKSLNQLSKEKDKLLSALEDIKLVIEISTKIGSVESVIVGEIQTNEYDILVMGKDGGEYIEKVSNSLKEFNSVCPLLVLYNIHIN